ncbi:MAG: tripartite tricarboxylate transporter permease [Chloroflexi bacterium]|nr:tripartite tricarboxylate transporter permease [Chloroflexota bacterium]
MAFEAFITALGNFGSLELWAFMLLGMATGLFFGLIPTTGALLAMALFLPFLFTMTPGQALPLLIGIGASVFQGGAITSILVGIPGTVPNAATVIDGYTMTKKGEAGRAIGAALTASGAGTIFTAVVALALIPLLLPLIMALRSGDMVFLVLIGIAFVVALTRGSTVKGLIAGGMGLMLSLVGFQDTTAAERFTFGSVYLYNGFELVALAMGIFAIPEVFAIAVRGSVISKSTAPKMVGMQGVWQGVKDVFHHKTTVAVSSVIGFVVGIIPGIGAAVATFVSYAVAKQRSKTPEKFGTGYVEGVIAPETADNAKEGGSLLTTLALGIPGSAEMVLILAAMMMVGLTPGPDMLTRHLDLSVTLLLVVLVIGILSTVICVPLGKYMAKVATVPSRLLAPLTMVIIFVGVYAADENFKHIVTLVIFGALGIVLRNYGYSRPALVLGFILGSLFEHYLFIALQRSGPTFFMRPISLGLIFVLILIFLYNPLKDSIVRRFAKGVRAQ